jgi:hypothetical protein
LLSAPWGCCLGMGDQEGIWAPALQVTLQKKKNRGHVRHRSIASRSKPTPAAAACSRAVAVGQLGRQSAKQAGKAPLLKPTKLEPGSARPDLAAARSASQRRQLQRRSLLIYRWVDLATVSA